MINSPGKYNLMGTDLSKTFDRELLSNKNNISQKIIAFRKKMIIVTLVSQILKRIPNSLALCQGPPICCRV